MAHNMSSSVIYNLKQMMMIFFTLLQDPGLFLCLLSFHLVPGFVLFCLYQLSVTVKSHFIITTSFVPLA